MKLSLRCCGPAKLQDCIIAYLFHCIFTVILYIHSICNCDDIHFIITTAHNNGKLCCVFLFFCLFINEDNIVCINNFGKPSSRSNSLIRDTRLGQVGVTVYTCRACLFNGPVPYSTMSHHYARHEFLNTYLPNWPVYKTTVLLSENHIPLDSHSENTLLLLLLQNHNHEG